MPQRKLDVVLDSVKRLQRMGATSNLVNLLQKQYPADLAQLFEWSRASGRLPLGTPGRIAFQSLARDVEALVAESDELRRGQPLPGST